MEKCGCGCGLSKPEISSYQEPLKNTKEMTDILDQLARDFQKMSDRAFILATRDNTSPAHVSERLRQELLLPCKDAIAQLENFEEKITNAYSVSL